MERRRKDLSELHDFIAGVDKEVNMVLQDLKWDRKRFFEGIPKLTCSYEKSHKLTADKMECHERQCFLKSHDYDKDWLLPDPLDADAKTLIKLDKQAIITIINNASCGNPSFKQGMISKNIMSMHDKCLFSSCCKTPKSENKMLCVICIRSMRSGSPEPWTLERLQATYTMDERRAIHDAVVQAVPSCHDLADLALPCKEGEDCNPRVKSRTEILAELRNMKRRRTKYRVAAKTRKYSDVLRNVIKTQMELYTGAAHQTTNEPDHDKSTPLHESKNQCRDHVETSIPPEKAETSHSNNGRQKSQEHNSPGDFQRRDRNVERNFPNEMVSSHWRDRGGRKPQHYYPSFYKNRDTNTFQKKVTSSAEERERGYRKDSSRYESRRAEYRPNEKERDKYIETRERQQQNYSSSSVRHKNNDRDSTLPEDAREHRKRHDYANTSRHGDRIDDKTSRKNYASHDYSYSARSKERKRHRESDKSSPERDENPSKRKHKDNRNRHSHKVSRERNEGRDEKVRIKLERDSSADRDLSDKETRYDYVYTSRPRDIHISSTRDRRSKEKIHHKSGHVRERYEDEISIKRERETPESNRIDTQSNYTRTSIYVHGGLTDHASSSDGDETMSRRHRRARRGYKDHTKVRIRRERSKTSEDGYHRRTSKRNRTGHSHRNRDSDTSSRSTESESRHGGRYRSSYGKRRIEETCIRIKKVKNITPSVASDSSWE